MPQTAPLTILFIIALCAQACLGAITVLNYAITPANVDLSGDTWQRTINVTLSVDSPTPIRMIFLNMQSPTGQVIGGGDQFPRSRMVGVQNFTASFYATQWQGNGAYKIENGYLQNEGEESVTLPTLTVTASNSRVSLQLAILNVTVSSATQLVAPDTQYVRVYAQSDAPVRMLYMSLDDPSGGNVFGGGGSCDSELVDAATGTYLLRSQFSLEACAQAGQYTLSGVMVQNDANKITNAYATPIKFNVVTPSCAVTDRYCTFTNITVAPSVITGGGTITTYVTVLSSTKAEWLSSSLQSPSGLYLYGGGGSYEYFQLDASAPALWSTNQSFRITPWMPRGTYTVSMLRARNEQSVWAETSSTQKYTVDVRLPLLPMQVIVLSVDTRAYVAYQYATWLEQLETEITRQVQQFDATIDVQLYFEELMQIRRILADMAIYKIRVYIGNLNQNAVDWIASGGIKTTAMIRLVTTQA